jgi:HEAT repeat protein
MTPRASRRALTAGLIVILGWMPAAAAQAEERRYEGRTLSDWAHLLQDPDPSAQRKAVEALRLGFDVQAVPVLNRAAETGDASVRIEAIRALAQVQPPAPETLATLSKAMRDTAPAIQRAAAAALGDVGAVSVLAQALKDPDKNVRRNAVRPLRRVLIRDRGSSDPATTRAVVTALADALKDPDGGIRRAAASSLGAIGPEAVDAIPSLAATTMDPDPSVRHATIEALGRIGSPAAVPVLVQALENPRTGSLAVRALGNMGPTARGAIPALREFQSQNGPSHSGEVEAAIKAIDRE